MRKDNFAKLSLIRYNQSMPWNSRIKLEPRGNEDPKFNPKNKTERKLLITLLSVAFAAFVIAVALIVCYYVFFK